MNTPSRWSQFDCLDSAGQSYERLTLDDLAALIHTGRLAMTNLVRVHGSAEWVPIRRWFSPPSTPSFWTWPKRLAALAVVVIATAQVLHQINQRRHFEKTYLRPLYAIMAEVGFGDYHAAATAHRDYVQAHATWIQQHDLQPEMRHINTLLATAMMHQRAGLPDAEDLAYKAVARLGEITAAIEAKR